MTFDQYIDEIEVFSSRKERLISDFPNLTTDEYVLLFKWLEAAYYVGRESVTTSLANQPAN